MKVAIVTAGRFASEAFADNALPRRPNIVLIMTDQQRADLCAREGYALDTTPFLDELAGRRVLVKAECLQHTGSFKFRGACNAIIKLPDDLAARGVVTHSSGNFAQALALAARLWPLLVARWLGAVAGLLALLGAMAGLAVVWVRPRSLFRLACIFDRRADLAERLGVRRTMVAGLTLSMLACAALPLVEFVAANRPGSRSHWLQLLDLYQRTGSSRAIDAAEQLLLMARNKQERFEGYLRLYRLHAERKAWAEAREVLLKAAEIDASSSGTSPMAPTVLAAQSATPACQRAQKLR